MLVRFHLGLRLVLDALKRYGVRRRRTSSGELAHPASSGAEHNNP
jgi:hypothetical protein